MEPTSHVHDFRNKAYELVRIASESSVEAARLLF